MANFVYGLAGLMLFLVAPGWWLFGRRRSPIWTGRLWALTGALFLASIVTAGSGDNAIVSMLSLLVAVGGLGYWWFGRKTNQPAQPVQGVRGGVILDVVGESHYQANLQRLCGKRKPDGEDRWFDQAALVAEPNNPADPNAVRVEIGGQHVGYLRREDAAAIADIAKAQPIPVRAHVRGGWHDAGGDHGHYGVRVEM